MIDTHKPLKFEIALSEMRIAIVKPQSFKIKTSQILTIKRPHLRNWKFYFAVCRFENRIFIKSKN